MTITYQVGDEPVPGTGYRLTAFLGRGGFGEVWKASAPGGAEAALKILRLGGTEGRKEFRALQLVKRIRHANLVPITGFWLKSEDGQVLDDAEADRSDLLGEETAAKPDPLRETSPALPDVSRVHATELVIAMGLGDQSLFDRLEECRRQGLQGIPREELIEYVQEAARAIDFLNSPTHDLGSGPHSAIQHCDIKPQNLLIVGGAVQLCDFGLARLMGTDRTTTAAATIAYAPPECLTKGRPSEATDQYSLAISYCELRTGKLPYPGKTLGAVIDAKRAGKLDLSRLPEPEQAVLRRATSRKPQDRYASTVEMVKALEQATGEAAEAPPRPKRRLGDAMVLAAVVLVGVVALGTWWLWPQQPAGSPGASAAELIGRAKQHFDRNEFDQAAADYSEAIRLDPAAGEARFGRARCYLQLEEYGKAIADLQRAKELMHSPAYGALPEFAEAFLARGTLALEEEEYAAAVTDLEQASKHKPDDARIFSRLGKAWFAQRQWDKAVVNLTTAIEIDPADTDYVNRGRAWRALENAENALADFQDAVKLNPQNAAAFVALGALAIEGDKTEPAIEHFSRAIQVAQESPDAAFPVADAFVLRASAYLTSGPDYYDRAAADFAEAIRLGNPQQLGHLHSLLGTLAGAYAQQGQFAEAARWAEKAVEWAPDDDAKARHQDDLQRYRAAGSGDSAN